MLHRKSGVSPTHNLGSASCGILISCSFLVGCLLFLTARIRCNIQNYNRLHKGSKRGWERLNLHVHLHGREVSKMHESANKCYGSVLFQPVIL